MTPWGTMLRAAARMGIGPGDFWRLSLKEWRALAGEADVLTRAGLEDLARRFPDEER